MQQIIKNLGNLGRIIVDFFPAATAAIIWGFSGADFIPGVSDTDILIIGPHDDAVEEKLKRLHDVGGELDRSDLRHTG